MSYGELRCEAAATLRSRVFLTRSLKCNEMVGPRKPQSTIVEQGHQVRERVGGSTRLSALAQQLGS